MEVTSIWEYPDISLLAKDGKDMQEITARDCSTSHSHNTPFSVPTIPNPMVVQVFKPQSRYSETVRGPKSIVPSDVTFSSSTAATEMAALVAMILRAQLPGRTVPIDCSISALPYGNQHLEFWWKL
jgi:hypothetical protein